MFYSQSAGKILYGYSDSDWEGDQDEIKSTTGHVFFLWSTAFTWTSKKQNIIVFSSCEAEYMAAAFGACEAVWLRNILKELDHPQLKSTIIYVDNKSAIQLAKNRVMHGRSKHIEIRFHFLREQVKQKVVTLKYCSTKEQIADIFTKALPIDAFKKFRSALGMQQLQV
jgi:hypothetical protein